MATGLNTGKVLVGGLLAGIVFFVGDFLLMATLMEDSMREMASAHNLTMDESLGAMAAWVVNDLVHGGLAVWVYAAIRPRFGAGVRTAVYASVAVWAAFMLTMAGFSAMGLFSTGVFLTIGLLWFVVVAVGTIAGAWAYKE